MWVYLFLVFRRGTAARPVEYNSNLPSFSLQGKTCGPGLFTLSLSKGAMALNQRGKARSVTTG
jgi:hypothetical protein